VDQPGRGIGSGSTNLDGDIGCGKCATFDDLGAAPATLVDLPRMQLPPKKLPANRFQRNCFTDNDLRRFSYTTSYAFYAQLA
jgi:hypothetical protein